MYYGIINSVTKLHLVGYCYWVVLRCTDPWILNLIKALTLTLGAIRLRLNRGCGPGSVVGIATGYGLDGPGIKSRWRRDFSHLSRPTLGPTQLPVQWVLGLSPGVKSGRGVTLTPHPLLVPMSWKSRAIPLLPLWAVRPVQSLSACTKVTFTFT